MIKNDKTATIDDLKEAIGKFVKIRKWQKYHTPKNLAASVVIEASELLEIFQWLEVNEKQIKKNSKLYKAVKEEISDVLAYVLDLANVLEIDIYKSFMEKLQKNEKKYPYPAVLKKDFFKF